MRRISPETAAEFLYSVSALSLPTAANLPTSQITEAAVMVMMAQRAITAVVGHVVPSAVISEVGALAVSYAHHTTALAKGQLPPDTPFWGIQDWRSWVDKAVFYSGVHLGFNWKVAKSAATNPFAQPLGEFVEFKEPLGEEPDSDAPQPDSSCPYSQIPVDAGLSKHMIEELCMCPHQISVSEKRELWADAVAAYDALKMVQAGTGQSQQLIMNVLQYLLRRDYMIEHQFSDHSEVIDTHAEALDELKGEVDSILGQTDPGDDDDDDDEGFVVDEFEDEDDEEEI